MNAQEIIKLLDLLIGGTEAVGDSAIDEKVEQNLMKLIDIVNWCIDGVAQSAETRHRPESSMRKIGERAFGALDEWRVWLTNRIDED